jgi:uncharacterized protein YaaW (UPF0174 family)
MAHLALRFPDKDLIPVLRGASSEDLEILVGFILKASTSELELVPEFKRLNPRAADGIYDGDHQVYADEIAAEIQKFGGNTIVNIFRGGKGVCYAEVIRDVADKLNVNYNDKSDVVTIKSQIQLKILEKAYEKMTNEERSELLRTLGENPVGAIPSALPVMAIQTAIKLGGFASFKIAVIVANAVARIILGRGLSFAAGATMTRLMGVFAGPVGWAATILWTLVDIAGPAYRVTIPCILHVAYIRQKSLVIACPSCGEINPKSGNFCQSCGAKI